MEFLFYIVACAGIVIVSAPLFSISSSLDKMVRVRVKSENKSTREYNE